MRGFGSVQVYELSFFPKEVTHLRLVLLLMFSQLFSNSIEFLLQGDFRSYQDSVLMQ